MTSPSRNPARAAVPDGSTSITTAPLVPAGTPSRLARSAVRPPSVMPKPAVVSSVAASASARWPASWSRLISPMVTFKVLRCLSRNTVSGTVVPGVSAMMVWTSSSRDGMGRLLTSRITSPGSTPALAAGPLAATDATTAPVRSLSPNSSRASRSTGWTCTPIMPRVILPVRSWGSRLRTTLIGTAKPMPMLPDWRESA